jgi:hypothetical protein
MLALDADTEDANAEDAKVDRPIQPHHVSLEQRLRLIRSVQIDYHRSLQPATSLSKLAESSDFVVDRGMISQLILELTTPETINTNNLTSVITNSVTQLAVLPLNESGTLFLEHFSLLARAEVFLKEHHFL